MLARAATISCLVCGLFSVLLGSAPAGAQTVIDSATDCLSRNEQANHESAAIGAVRCFNRNMAAIARRKAEIESIVRLVDRCRGVKTDSGSQTFSCQIATVAGVIGTSPIGVRNGACSSDWNRFSGTLGSVLFFGCRRLARNDAARFDRNGRLVIRMNGPDEAFMETVGEFLNAKRSSEDEFQVFSECFVQCGRREAQDVFARYGVKGYKDLSRRYGQLLRAYRREDLESKFAQLANRCAQVSKRWWNRLPPGPKEQLICRTPNFGRSGSSR